MLRLRFRPSHHVLAGLFGVSTGTIATSEHQIRPLLDQHGYAIKPAGTLHTTLAGLTAYASAHGLVLTPKTQTSALIMHPLRVNGGTVGHQVAQRGWPVASMLCVHGIGQQHKGKIR